MAYVAPGIDEHGIHVPEYEDIKQRLLDSFRTIFGEDLYLGEDTQDYQMIAEFADLYDDICSLAVDVYSSRNPDFATGTSLDLIVPLNGLRRNYATYSTAVLTLYGDVGSVIPSGSIVQDVNGYQWAIDADAEIGEDGSAETPATCNVAGNIPAEPNTITEIMSPTIGWTSVTNESAAIAGEDIETDAELHERRALSFSNSSISMIESLTGSILGINGVVKSRVYENKNRNPDSRGIPGNSICAVVLGGDDAEVAGMIFRKKSPGCGTHGTTTIDITDSYDQINSISFSRPVEKAVDVVVNLKTFAGYNTEISDKIKNNIKAYIDGKRIGESLDIGLLWACVLAVNEDATKPVCVPYSVTAGFHGDIQQSVSLNLNYDEYMTSAVGNITINVQP